MIVSSSSGPFANADSPPAILSGLQVKTGVPVMHARHDTEEWMILLVDI